MSNLVINIGSRKIIATKPIYFFGYGASRIWVLSFHLALSATSFFTYIPAVSRSFTFPKEINRRQSEIALETDLRFIYNKYYKGFQRIEECH